ncbi:hypothetical protein NG42_13000 [Winslowiella iniecta]|uniref:Pesticidal crystal protein N-terminal domain-containing protein n=2 Tax=Winslowiella iniecta TaxID=1560201 RepID=A0A0L7THD6_9GAMM|nr:hypothetical protein NG42_13000 [Winslowiella iniecta]KOC94813.1 hypothetical protein NG43_03260 [Winslowiella iniecta]
MSEAAANGFSNLHGALDQLFKDAPVLAMSSLVESLILKLAGGFLGGIAGPLFSGAITGLFSYFNNLFTTSKPSIEEEIRRITGQMIDDNNYGILKSRMQGLTTVCGAFNTSLKKFLDQQTRSDLKGEVLNRFSNLIGHLRIEMPLFLNISNGIGYLFYMQAAALGLISYTQLLSNRKTLNLDDDYYELQFDDLRNDATSWMKVSQENLIKRYHDTGFKTNEVIRFCRNVYTGGYAMLLSAYRASFSLEAGVELNIRNTAELYSDAPTDVANGSFTPVLAKINKDIHLRSSLLADIGMMGHLDNVLAINHGYFDGTGQYRRTYFESCYNPSSHPKVRYANRDFNLNPFQPGGENIDGGTNINTMIINMSTSASGARLYYLRMLTPTGALQPTNNANESGLYNINIPNYYISGLVVGGYHNGKQCTADAGWGLRVDCAIFRHYDGLETKRVLEANEAGEIKKGIAYELDFNGGYVFNEDGAPHNNVYSDILIGKNIITSGENHPIKMNFTLIADESVNMTWQNHIKILIFSSELQGISRLMIRDDNDNRLFSTGVTNFKKLPNFEIKSLAGKPFYLYELQVATAAYSGPLNQIRIELQPQNSDCHFASMTLITM